MHDPLDRQVHELLKQSFELSPNERRDFVLAVCEQNPQLRTHAMRLMAAIDDSQSFLEKPALESAQWDALRAEPEVPERVGGYRIVRKLGAGGMGTVYEAIQHQPQRAVALKIPRRRWGESTPRQLRYESEVLARLRHANIAQIFEAGIDTSNADSPLPFFAMEFVPQARTIREYARDTQLSLEDKLAMFIQVCDAVQHGHQHGVIHRDLKPANILVDSEGNTKVIDFGVASSRDSETIESGSIESDSRELIGTLNYMSPEQCDPGAVIDVQTDVYSLGVVLYELLCDRLPHDLKSVPMAEAMRLVRESPPTPPSSANPKLAKDLEAVVLKAIAGDRDVRYRSVDALRTDIVRFMKHQPVEAQKPTPLYLGKLFARRHRLLVGAIATVLLAIITGTVLSSHFAWRMWQEAEHRKVAEAQAVQERDEMIWQNYVANIAAAFAALQTREFRQTRSRLAQAPEQHRGWEWRFLSGMTDINDQIIEAHDDMILGFDVSHDGQYFATACRDGSVKIWDAAHRTLVRTILSPHLNENQESANEQTQGTLRAMAIAFNPEGDRMVVGTGNGTVQIFETLTGQQVFELGAHATAVTAVAFHSGGWVASASQDGHALLWDSKSGESVVELNDEQENISGVAFSCDGQYLTSWSRDGSVWLRTADGASVLQRWAFDGSPRVAVFSPDSQWVAAGNGQGQIRVWRVTDSEPETTLQTPRGRSTIQAITFTENGELFAGRVDRAIMQCSIFEDKVVRTFDGHEEAISGLWYDHRNQRLYSTSWDRTIRVWNFDASQPMGGIKAFRGHQDHVLSVSFSPDGGILASGSRDRTVRLWDPTLKTLLAELRGHDDAVNTVKFSPDGSLIASGSNDHSIRIWCAVTGEHLDTLSGHTGGVVSLAFSPDGCRLGSAGDDMTIRIWDVAQRNELHCLHGHQTRVNSVTFSPDGSRIASASRDHSVRLWNATDGSSLYQLDGHRADVFAVIFSHDGERLYSGSRDQTVRVWDAGSGQFLDQLDGHGQFVTSLDLSPDGRRLVAGSWFGEIVLWDTDRHEVVASFKGHDQAIRSVAFCPTGDFLATGSHDHELQTYDTHSTSERTRQHEQAQTWQSAAQNYLDSHLVSNNDLRELAQQIDSASELDPVVKIWCKKLLLQHGPSGVVDHVRSPVLNVPAQQKMSFRVGEQEFETIIETPVAENRHGWGVVMIGGGLGNDLDWTVPGWVAVGEERLQMTLNGETHFDGPRISRALLDHGFVTMRWSTIAKDDPLAAQWPVNSTPRTLSELLEQSRIAVMTLRHSGLVDVNRIVLVGHSLGAARACTIASDDEGIQGLVLLAPACFTKSDSVPKSFEAHGMKFGEDVLSLRPVPCLALFGGLDDSRVVNSSAAGELAATKIKRLEVRVFPGLGHQLGRFENGRHGPIEAEVVKAIVEWVNQLKNGS